MLKGRLPAAAGAMLIKALDAALDTLPENEVSAKFDEDWPIPHAARRADALAAVAESFLAKSDASSNTADRFQVVVHVDAETLQQRAAGRCEIEHGPAIPAETARRLSCDASLISVLENEQGEPLDVGRKTRSIPPAIRRALNTRDAGCRFPGCTHRRYVDAHHIEHWADGGETKLSNLVTFAACTTVSCTKARSSSKATPPAAGASCTRTAGLRGHSLQRAPGLRLGRPGAHP